MTMREKLSLESVTKMVKIKYDMIVSYNFSHVFCIKSCVDYDIG